MNDIAYVGKHLRTYNVSKHSHDNWELVYCTDGSGRFVFDDGTVLPYKKGDTVIIPPNVRHENFSDEGFLNIHINIVGGTLPFSAPSIISDDTEGHILSAFETAFYFFHSQINKRHLILSAYGNLIANYLIAFRSNKPLSKLVEEIKSDIIKNFSDPEYNLEEFMCTFPFSYDYLRKLFKSEMGVTPHSYLIEMRMQTAEQLLIDMEHNEYNISMIAQMCGYVEPLYFSRVFKKHFGCPPSMYLSKRMNDEDLKESPKIIDE